MASLFGLKQSQSEGLESPSRNCCVTSGETSLPASLYREHFMHDSTSEAISFLLSI